MSIAGTILRVDLTESKIEKEPTSSYVRDYLGGRGIGAKIIYDEVPPDVSPYDPRNMISFNAGPLTGTLKGNKIQVITRSPLLINNLQACAGMGGQLAVEMKFAGYDNIIIKGKADAPVYLFIDNDKVEIRDAKHLWGLDTWETQKRLKEELKEPDVQIACIGLAGENLVAYALILHDINSTASRSGHGAVMGSKNLKAIAVRGTNGVKVADPETFMALWKKEYAERYSRPPSDTSMGEGADNWTQVDMEQWGYEYKTLICPPVPSHQSQKLLREKYAVGKAGCAFCPTQCNTLYNVPGVGACATVCMMNWCYRYSVKSYDIDLWYRAAFYSSLYGIDCASMSSIVGWLMELYERGIITAADTDGVPMEWGNKEAVLTTIAKVAKREGFGKVIADGIVPAARKIGKGSIKYALQTKGADYCTYAPGAAGVANWLSQAIALGGALTQINPLAEDMEGSALLAELAHPELPKGLARKPIDAIRSAFTQKYTGDSDAWQEFDEKGEVRYKSKAKLTLAVEDLVTLADILGYCDWSQGARGGAGPTPDFEKMAPMLKAATGMNYTPEMLLEVVQRTRLLERAYDYLCGMRREDEVVADSLFEPTETRYHGTVTMLDHDKFEALKSEYYELRGCDPETGAPARKELERLGLKDVADKLDKLGLEKAPAASETSSKRKQKVEV